MIGWRASFREQSLVMERYPIPRAGRPEVTLAADLVEVCVGMGSADGPDPCR
ncbi:MAG: hypothetical protein M3Y59_17620 [Myxococcota bacterium]|nr:hypothetical protein [Myxococcota bacterium]